MHTVCADTRTLFYICSFAVHSNPRIKLSSQPWIYLQSETGEPHSLTLMLKLILITVSVLDLILNKVLNLVLPDVPHKNRYVGVDECTWTDPPLNVSVSSCNDLTHCRGDTSLQQSSYFLHLIMFIRSLQISQWQIEIWTHSLDSKNMYSYNNVKVET